jgi:flavoprotein
MGAPVLELVGTAKCLTPVTYQRICPRADVVKVGRFLKLICQGCGGCWGLSDYGFAHLEDVYPGKGTP